MTATLAWGMIAVAIGFEIAGTAMLKLADGFQKPAWFFAAITAYAVCFAFFAQAIRHVPLSIAYAVWAGMGAALIVAIDVYVFGQSLTALKVGFIAMIIVGVVGLKLAS